MKLSAPKFVTFLIALIVGVVAIVSMFVTIPVIGAIIAPYVTYMLMGAFGLLVLSVIFKGL